MDQIDETTMNSIGFAILCNFQQYCGVERAMEASEQFRAMKEELLAYRAVMPLEELQALKDAEAALEEANRNG